MGNCLTCYKVPPPGEPQPVAPIEKDKEGKAKNASELVILVTNLTCDFFFYRNNGSSKIISHW